MEEELIIALIVKKYQKNSEKYYSFFGILDIIILYVGLVMYVKKTKIICSVGPACESVEVMEDMVRHGMNCARINLSHATYDGCEKTIDIVRKVRKTKK